MRIIQNMMAAYDRSVVKLSGWKVVPGSDIGFLYLVPKIYKGKPVKIEDGTVISKGDRYYQIHIINTNLANLDTSHENLYAMLMGELKLVGKHMQKKENSAYKGLLAVTLLHSLVRKCGFTLTDFENPVERKLVSLGENLLRNTLRKEKDKGPKKKRIAKKCWISRKQLISMSS